MNPEGISSRRILVIDDNQAIHQDFRKIFRAASPARSGLDAAEAGLFGGPVTGADHPWFEIDSAFQGQESLTLIQEALRKNRPYAMAFVDVRMPPGWDGIETTKRIWEICPDLQIVICTAYADCSWSEMHEKINPLDRLLILKKPFDPVEVVQLAHALTEKWRLMRESKTRLSSVEQMVKDRTQELEASQIALLNMMDDAVRNRRKAEEAYEELKREVTERKKLEAQFLQSQKMEAFGQLAGGVAHDFNNILSVIMGYSNLLLEEEDLRTDVKDQLKQVYSAGERAANLTRQLLTFSRKKEMQVSALDLNEIVANLTKMLGRIIGEDVKLQCDFASNLPSIHADEGMMEQVLMNLAVNARDAMSKGGRLIISTERLATDAAFVRSNPEARVGEFVRLTVRDTGCGMIPEIKSRIFEPFFTTKDVGKGTGLGLATVFGIVKQHHGWLEVESQVGAGTTFKVFLPASPRLSAAVGHGVEGARVRGGTETILLVEDEAALRALARVILQRHGYRVLEAASGVEALEVWEKQGAEVGLLLTDMVMPDGLTGRELAKQLLARKPGLKVIYVSGYSIDTEGTTFRMREGITYLQKPYHPKRLAETVRAAFDRP